MGDRASIAFRKDQGESVTLCSHWGGMHFVREAKEYVKELKEERKGSQVNPLDRLEPDTVMVDFIRHLTHKMKRVESDLYIVADESQCDNSDNGHHLIDL
jgi:hypothetical protein